MSSSHFKNLSYLVSGQSATKVITFFWYIYLARFLGVADYGRYSLVMVFVGLAAALPDFGVSLIAVRDISRDRSLAASYLGTQIQLGLLFSLAAYALMIGAMSLFGYPEQLIMLGCIGGLYMVINLMGRIGDTVFSSFEKQKYTAFMNVFSSVLWIVFGFAAFRLNSGLTGFFWAIVAGNALVTLVYWIVVTNRFVKPDFTFSWPRWKYLLGSSWGFGLTIFLIIAISKADRILISLFHGERMVGIYNASAVLVGPLTETLLIPFMVVLYPVMSYLYVGDQNKFVWFSKQALLATSIVSLPITAAVFLYAPQILQLLFGQQYQESYGALRWLVSAFPVMLYATYFARVLIVAGKQVRFLVMHIMAFAFNIILNLALIPRFGYNGAAVSSFATWILLLVLSRLYTDSYRHGYFSFMEFAKVGMALAAGLLVISRLGSIFFVVNIVIFFLVYAGTVFLLFRKQFENAAPELKALLRTG